MKLNKKGGELLKIQIEEVSVVDAPANQRKFLFFKSDLKKAAADFSVQSDGTTEGTSITVNGKTLEDLKSFQFSYYKPDADEEMYFDPVSLSFTLTTANENGFKTSETYELAKQRGNIMDYAKLGAFVKTLTGRDVTEEQFKKMDETALNELDVLSQYEGQMPVDLKKAVGYFLKDMDADGGTQETQDDTNKTDQSDPPEIKAEVLESLKTMAETLNALIAGKKPDEPTDDSAVLAELTKITDGIAKLSKGKPEPKPKDADTDPESDTAKILKLVEGFDGRLGIVEKSSGVKKGIDDDAGGGEKDPYSSLNL